MTQKACFIAFMPFNFILCFAEMSPSRYSLVLMTLPDSKSLHLDDVSWSLYGMRAVVYRSENNNWSQGLGFSTLTQAKINTECPEITQAATKQAQLIVLNKSSHKRGKLLQA